MSSDNFLVDIHINIHFEIYVIWASYMSSYNLFHNIYSGTTKSGEQYKHSENFDYDIPIPNQAESSKKAWTKK